MNEQFSKFLSAYQIAPQPIKDLIDSEKIGLFIDTILTDATAKPKLLVIISNHILGITKDSEMVSALETIPEINLDIISKIKKFITDTTGTDVEASISEIEKMVETLPSIRTMATDGKVVGYHSVEETTHTSDQSNLLQK